MRDLDRLRLSLGGRVPVGVRDIWLHLYATCLSHTSEAATIPNLFQTMAAEATPGLSPSEVAGVAKVAARHASVSKSGTPLSVGLYHYAGAKMAESRGTRGTRMPPPQRPGGSWDALSARGAASCRTVSLARSPSSGFPISACSRCARFCSAPAQTAVSEEAIGREIGEEAMWMYEPRPWRSWQQL